MRQILVLLMVLFLSLNGQAEGSRELSPTGNMTSLYVGESDQGNFAAYTDGPPTSSKLNVRIIDPSREAIHFGFSRGRDPAPDFNAVKIIYTYVIKDPNGHVVFYGDTIEDHGNIRNLDEARVGPSSLYAQGYNEIVIDPAKLMSGGWNGEGDYYIEFQNLAVDRAFIVFFWDVTVVSHGSAPLEEKKGRLWSDNWALFTPGLIPSDNFSNAFEGGFYVVSPDENNPDEAFISYMDFKGSEFHAAAFGIALNDFGAKNTGTVTENRKSVASENTVQGKYPIFLNDPVDLFKEAVLGDIRLLGTTGCLPANFCILFESDVSGEIEVLIDLSGNNLMYDLGTEDVLLTIRVNSDEINRPLCLPWNGLTGRGTLYEGEDFEMLPIHISFRQGLFHFPVYDVEINRTGFNLKRVRPSGPSPLIYYDDGNIPFSSGTGSPNVNLNGCVVPCHSWDGSVQYHSYGNLNTINSWWYARDVSRQGDIELRFAKESQLTASFCEDDFFTFQDSIITEEGEHKFYFVSRAGCDSVHTVHAVVVQRKSVISSDGSTLNCSNPTIILNGASSLPINNVSYTWLGPAGTVLQTGNNFEFEVSTPGEYTLIVEEIDLNCTDESSIVITKDFLYPTIDLVSKPLYRCHDEEKIINIFVDESVYQSKVKWQTTDGIIVDRIMQFSPTIRSSGTYVVSALFEENGCSVEETIVINRDTNSYLEISGDDEIAVDFCDEIRFNNEINSTQQVTYEWTPDTLLSCGDCLNPVLHTVGAFEYTLMACDSNNCVMQANRRVVLNDDFLLYIPSAFSPNNDGINDEFGIYSSPCEIQVDEFFILNHWGDRVFQRTDFLSTDQKMSWDGFVRGRAAEIGAYVYVVELKLHNGESALLKGGVQLMK